MNPIFIVLFFITLICFCICGKFYFDETFNNVSNSIYTIPVKLILNNEWFTTLSDIDLKARLSVSQEDYRRKYINNLMRFSRNEIKHINNLIFDIDALLRIYKELNKIPWKLAKVSKDIENGYPHTINDTIFINQLFFSYPINKQIYILIHEKIHVYQRMFPIQTHDLILNYWGFEVEGLRAKYKLARANPDINSLVYSKNEIITLQIYNSTEPRSLSDSQLICFNRSNLSQSQCPIYPDYINQLEHPFEIMGCLIPKIILKWYDIAHDQILLETTKWMFKTLV